MAKYVLLCAYRFSVIAIKQIDEVINDICYNNDKEICGFMSSNSTLYSGIVCCQNVANVKDLSNEIVSINSFHAYDSIELMIRLETEGFISECEHKPTSIHDFISQFHFPNNSLDIKDVTISRLSVENAKLQDENNDLKKQIKAFQRAMSHITSTLNIQSNDLQQLDVKDGEAPETSL